MIEREHTNRQGLPKQFADRFALEWPDDKPGTIGDCLLIGGKRVLRSATGVVGSQRRA